MLELNSLKCLKALDNNYDGLNLLFRHNDVYNRGFLFLFFVEKAGMVTTSLFYKRYYNNWLEVVYIWSNNLYQLYKNVQK